MKKQILVGCSSFNNRLWKGIFYPEDLPGSKWFAFYCEHFDTYEMNSTFYKAPTLRVMQNWYHRAPEGFLFSVKVPKWITHIKRMKDCPEGLTEFYSICSDGLKEKLGFVLFQFPPSFHYSEERLQEIIGAVDPKFENVVEFRHNSWWISEVEATLSKHQVVVCSVDYPKLPRTVFSGSTSIYMRLHGSPQLFYSEYSSEELTRLKKEILETKAQKVMIYFNNTASTAGILNAIEMKKRFG